MEPTANDIAALAKIAAIIDDADIATEPTSGTPEAAAWVKRYGAAVDAISAATMGSGAQGGFDTPDLAGNIGTAAGQSLADLRTMLGEVL
jgi:hypothetical protein